MSRTNYQRGREFEYRTRKRLREMGAVYIMRAASSKGAADLISLWPARLDNIFDSQVWLIQCKMDGKLPKKEREELQRLAKETGKRAVLAYKSKRGTLLFKDIVTGRAIADKPSGD